MENSLSMIRWNKHVQKIKMYLTGKDRTVPAIMKRFGTEKFTMKGDSLFYDKREIIYDAEQKKKIIEQEDEKYGGQTKAFERLSRRYLGISRRDVAKGYRGSERRQLKARFTRTDRNRIKALKPGHIEIDITFYKGFKIPVFGAIDVFSRYAYYERIPDKKAISVLSVLKNFIKKFENNTIQKVYKISTDSGSEFQKEFTEYLKERKIFYDRQVKSRKLIENLNASLRHYIERIGWSTIKDLDELIKNFVNTYNDSKHSTTKKTPNDMMKIRPSTVADNRKPSHSGFTVAELKAGDRVRIYDPRRKDVKEEMKKLLKGKIKLSNEDYVKQFTSFHRGQAPHWTKKVYHVKSVHYGKKRSTRYLLREKKGWYYRHELQKVALVTKKDPRVKILAKRKEDAKKIEAALPKAVRTSKYLRKKLIAHYKDDEQPSTDDPATVIEVYKNFLIVYHKSEYISWIAVKEIHKLTGQTIANSTIKRLLKDFDQQVITAKKEIDEEIDKIKKNALAAK